MSHGYFLEDGDLVADLKFVKKTMVRIFCVLALQGNDKVSMGCKVERELTMCSLPAMSLLLMTLAA